MRSSWKKIAAGAAIGTVMLGSLSLPAAADGGPNFPELAGTGWDGAFNQVVNQGSDTTYPVQNDLAVLYNEAPGCATVNSSSLPADWQECVEPQTIPADTKGNFDHDVIVNRFPTGSSAGVKALVAGSFGVNMARSSRGPAASGEGLANFWGFAKDGIAILSMGGRAATSMTGQRLLDIYTCKDTNPAVAGVQLTTWQMITGNPADAGKVVRPYGMNPASGTKASMDKILTDLNGGTAVDANSGTCKEKLEDGITFPFENDLKPVLQAEGVKGTNAADVLWWGSYGDLTAFPYKAQDAEFWAIDEQQGAGPVSPNPSTIADNSYLGTRFLYHVTLKSHVSDDGIGGTFNTTGATGGVGGAVREYTEWLCKRSPEHTLSSYTGNSLFTEITAALGDSGFIRVPAPERDVSSTCTYEPAP